MSFDTLCGLLPNYGGIHDLAAQAQAINAAAAQGQITYEEHQALLEDLVRTQVIMGEAQSHEQRLFADQVLKALASLPLPA